ncbi:MAG TPA: polysaccharide biosynthesis tyrosine autokinase [Flavipsychrobacter sp.]|nr:polysaccharide biosynthesis tyrosine autokinase [Flavipsychrobacter sp.]
MENNQISDRLRQINSGIDFKRLLGSVLSKWYWFILSLFVTFSLGFLYLRYTTPLYSVQSLLLIEDKQKGVGSLLNKLNDGSSGGDASGGNNPNLFNEMFVLTSQDLVGMVVDSLDLHIQYWAKGRVREDELYDKSPIVIVFDSLGYLGGGTQELRFTQLVDGLFEFNEADIKSNVLYGSWIKRPYGRFKILYREGPNVNRGYLTNKTEIIARISPSKFTINYALAVFKVTVSDGRTSLLDLKYTDNIPQRGVDFMNALIYYYRKKELEDLNISAEKTREFINQQKTTLIDELQSRDSIEEEIKTQNKIIDVKSQASTILTGKAVQQEKIQQLIIQKQAVQSLKDNIIDGVGSRYEVMAGVSANDPVITALVTEYNTLIQKKELLERNTAPLHPSLVKIKNDIAALRKNIADACDRVISSINISIQNASRNVAEYNESMASIPAAERSINNTKREYPLIQGVYLYLYQRGVENDIAQYAAANKSKVVVAPYSIDAPIKPVRNTVYALVVLMGLLIPSTIIITRVMLNNKVINEKDIEALTTLPVIGSIARTPNGEKRQIVVGPHIRTGVAEQFRLIRANLEFMSSSGTKKVYLITSSMSGEGKTFVSLNLGITMTLAKKRVVIMEYDLRKPKLSSYLGLHNEGGISSYLAGISGIEKVIKASGVHENLYIANCGPIPPNPGELLVLPTAQQLIEELHEMFDIIIMDTAPIGLVSDALILSQHSDINMFVVRQSYTMKEQIKLFDTLYQERKIRNAAIVFNGVEYLQKYGYGYSGSYGYGYQYSSGYYEDDVKKKKTIVDKLFRK